jgi:hypothetical protein
LRGDAVVRAREWWRETAHAVPDPLAALPGATRAVSRLDYVHKGFVRANPLFAASGVTAIRHVLRFDLAPFIGAIESRDERVPIVDKDAHLRFVDAARRERALLTTRLCYEGHAWQEAATLVLERRGIARLERP